MNGRAASRAFSLAEVMLAMFILGIGIVALASIFPAGIAQQRQSADDIIGPIVAENALAVLRTKLRQDDFGTFEEHVGVSFSPRTIPGDWTWRRPGFFLGPGTITLDGSPAPVRAGTISIFDVAGSLPDANSEIPWNTNGNTTGPRLVVFSQQERYYPMQTDSALNSPRPEYVWDCMFRRFQGKILVAIFVYRVSLASGGAVSWAPPANGTIPPMPVDLPLLAGSHPWQGQAWGSVGADPANPRDDAEIKGTDPVSDPNYDPTAADESWQLPGQWLLDENNNIHRILSGRRSKDDGPVELVRPVPPVTLSVVPPATYPYLGSPFNYDPTVPAPLLGLENVVSRIWYIPSEVQIDTNGNSAVDPSDLPVTLTPVYIGVSEL